MSTRDFDSINAFLIHLAEAEVAIHVATHHVLDEAGKIIEKDAKEQIGEYQGDVGSFGAWPELAESTKQDRVSKGYQENEPLLRTGELRDSISHEVQGDEVAVGSTSDIMVYQELGTDKIPPRPVLGPAAYKKKDEIEKVLGTAVMRALEYGAAGGFVRLPE